MPCHDSRDNFSWSDHERARQEWLQEMSVLTRYLCSTLRFMESMGLEPGDVYDEPNLTKWWENHKEHDKQRRHQEMEEKKQAKIRELALNKLTAAEKEALGLK